MPSIRLPLATSFLNRSFTVDKDSKIVNGYIEKYTEDHTAVVKRPGLSLYKTGLGCGQGFYTSNNGTLYTVSNNTVVDTSVTVPGKLWVETATNAFATGRTLGGFVSFNNKLWYLGGLTSTVVVTNDIYSSSDGITWTLETTSNPFTARYGHQAVVFNNKIYILGGTTGTHQLMDVWSSTDGINWTNNSVDIYPTNGNYQRRSKFSTIVFNNTLYVIGGFDGINALDTIYSTIDGTTWINVTTIGNKWAARLGTAVISHSNKIWLSGGQLVNETGATVNDVWTTTDCATWTQVTAAANWSTRVGHGMLSFLNKLFVIAGSHDASTSLVDVWSSDDGITWIDVGANPFESRSFMGCLVFDGMMWVAGGGIVGGSRLPSVWSSSGGNTFTGPSCIPISFNQASSSASNKYVMYKTTTAAYLINISSGLTSQITDVNFPTTTVPGIVFLDGYFFVMTPTGEIHNSALEDPTTWPSLDFINAEMEPDSGVAIAKHLNYLVAFGAYTTEFFFDAANALGSPLQRVDNAFMFYGCASGYSIVHMNNTLVWMSVTQQQGRQIAVMNGFAPQIISTPFVERILAADDLATVYAFNTKVNGHDFYILTLKTSNITLAYDFVTKQWFQWTSMRVQASKSVTALTLGTDGATATASVTAHGYADGDRITITGANQTAYNGDFNISYADANTFTYQVTGTPVSPATGTITALGYTEGYFRGIAGSISNGVNLVQDEVTGNLYKIDMSNYDDATGYINFLVRTTNFDAGSMNTKYPSRLEMIGDKETNSHLLVRYSNDDYVTYSKYRKLDLSKKRSRLNRLGSFKRRTFDLRHTDTTPLRLEQVEMEIDKEGT